jgi:predicted GNAT family acetyltransferase
MSEPDAAAPQVIDDIEQDRFVFEQDGATAVLAYEVEDGRLLLLHTGVPEQLGGRGVGGRLVEAAVVRAARDGLEIAPWCPFVRKWLKEHADAVSGVTIDWSPPPGLRG